MSPRSWTPTAGGSVTAAPTDEYPDLISLTSAGAGFEQFDGSPVPDALQLALVFATGSGFAVYVEASTSAGRRQFKFGPGPLGAELRFGYRYQVGLGDEARDGSVRSVALDLGAIATEAEPGTAVDTITAVFVRLAGVMAIDVQEATSTPPPPSDGPIARPDAARFLQQATFGPTMAAIDELAGIGSYDAWIDAQLAAPISLTVPYVKANSNGSLASPRHEIWWKNAVEGPDQLRQRVAFAWSQIFVVSDIDYELRNAQYAMAGYYDMLATEGLGTFRQLLEKVTLHPVMGIYLSMLRNEKADPARNVRPDENFAREILQLFTIGLEELTPSGELSGGASIPTFDQSTIEEFAKVFTGWNLANTDRWTSNDLTAFDKESPMVPVEEYHDTSAKQLLGRVRLPAGQDARRDLTQALDNIVVHPNVGPFVSRLLIQRLTTSNPSPSFVGRVAATFADDGAGVRGNLAAVVRAILTDAEARNGHRTAEATFGKIKEPILRLTQLWRAFEARPGSSAGGVYRPYAKSIDQIGDVLGQAPMRSPSVFNFYQPDHPLRPGSSLVAPEAQILAEIDVASTNNMLFQQIYSDNNRTGTRTNIATIDIDREVALAGDVDALLDHLDVLLVAGRLPVEQRRAIASHLTAAHPDTDATGAVTEEARIRRALDAVFCIVGSPVHLVQT